MDEFENPTLPVDYNEVLAKLLASPIIATKEEVYADRGFLDKGDIIILVGEHTGVQDTVQQALQEGLIKSANHCSVGGLAVALAECCMIGGVGARVSIDADFRTDALLFGETPSRVIVSLKREQVEKFAALANQQGVPTTVLGMVEGETLDILANDDFISLPVGLIEKIWRRSIECAKQ